MSRCRHPRRERGFALFLALLVLLVVTISGIALLFNTQIESSLSATETKISKAFYAADSGISWATNQLATNARFQFTGGSIPAPAGQPAAMSANIPGQPADIQVTVSTPIVVGYRRRNGDEIGIGTYPLNDIVEKYYHMTSTSTSTELQATKSITCDMGIYPQNLVIPQN